MKKLSKLKFWHNLGLGSLQLLILGGVYQEAGLFTVTFCVVVLMAILGILQKCRKMEATNKALYFEYKAAKSNAELNLAHQKVTHIFIKCLLQRLKKLEGKTNADTKEPS